ncbi:putative transketolase [Schizosaccharomyces pombe]|uniref:Probable transketolase n=1 Tax=Schizosaccharomyces pombe (strain 972 / ATCC 24843) TaxID=284812 RepID=TKT_SCHPO|nr:putative transketolase [Schizosaccharomyces pombe]Q9URM2.1 RecName: Full=Probable transketolase; Short=TK [Schizosaccharomyces pombe 972h-]CAA21881.1 transketolase (predicted) [Schizosaccharomyces pombe]|eukprot:NP_596066.1 putative transketolase [Schizosaccharomyces pombe]
MTSSSYTDIDTLAINTIRTLAVDTTAHAKSGHPGAPMGLAPAAHVLFSRIMKFNPAHPKWLNRDRFILSNGHACVLQYIMCHLLGYKLTIEDLKQFRQVGSKTPGHPETHNPDLNIETGAGPLGQGIASAVGLAIGKAHSAAVYNKPGFDLFSNYTFCFLGDGCLQEGVSSEACSLAGHLKLSNLIAVWDNNKITIDGATSMSFDEDVEKRFEAYGWNIVRVANGDTDLDGIEKGFREAMSCTDKPTLINLKTTIGYGSELQGTHSVHGSPLKPEDCVHVKKLFGFDPTKTFQVPPEVYAYYKERVAIASSAEEEYKKMYASYKQSYPDLSNQLERILSRKFPEGWEKHLPVYKPGDKAVATRKLSEIVLDALCPVLPELVGGSADLTPSNLTRWEGAADFQPPSSKLGTYAGRYIRYGIREHGMAGIMNGLAVYGPIIPYGGTFLNFVSYAAGAVRMAALNNSRVIYVATHDSIGLGEDGPTHQPIETFAHFRAMPNINCWRPADGNETSAAYYSALTSDSTPSILALTRQNLPQLENSTIENALKGGYVMLENKEADITLVGTGSEVSLCIDTVKTLETEYNLKARVVSLPCWEVFEQQPESYRLSVIPDGIPAMSVEVWATNGWRRYVHEAFGMHTFGDSGPAPKLYEKFHFTTSGVAQRAKKTVDAYKDIPYIRSPVRRAF